MSWILHVDAEAGTTSEVGAVELAGAHSARTMREEGGEKAVVWKSSQSSVWTRNG